MERSEKGLSRRDFIVGSAITAAVAASAGAASAYAGAQKDVSGSGSSASAASAASSVSATSSASSASAASSPTASATSSASGNSSVFDYGAYQVNMDNVDPIPAVSEPEAYDYETDVLVIGYGVGGTSAALTALNRGCKVMAMERCTQDNWYEHGGVVFLVAFGEKSWLEEAGLPDWGEETVTSYVTSKALETLSQQDLEAAVNCMVNIPNAYQQIVDLGSGCSFFRNRGIDSWAKAPCFTPLNDNLSDGGSETYPWVNKYFAVENVILNHSTDMGLQVLWGTPAIALIVDGDGKVVGAKGCDGDGNVIYVKASSVIDCIGGFASNYDMIKYYGMAQEVCGCNVQGLIDDGAGQRMCEGAGAGVRGLPRCDCLADGGIDAAALGLPWNHLYHDDAIPDKFVNGYMDPAIFLARQPNSLRVNKYGYRFVNEAAGWMTKTYVASKQPEHRYFEILDSDMDNQFETIYTGDRNGICEYTVTADRTIYFSDDDIRPMSDWHVGLQKAIDAGLIYKCDTLEELADKLGINKENFLDSVDRYNQMCDAGEDTDFGKDPVYLYPIKNPPFYGMDRKNITWLQMAGVAADKDCRVLDKKGAAIPGLYVGANDAALTDATTADYHSKGVLPTGAGFAITVGYMAANTAADDIAAAGTESAAVATGSGAGEKVEFAGGESIAHSSTCTSCHSAPTAGNFTPMSEDQIVDMFTTNHSGITVSEEDAQALADFALGK